MTRAKTPIIDDWTTEPIDETETRYTVEFTKSTEKKGQIIKTNRLDMSAASFKKFVLDKGISPKWTILTKQADGKWESSQG